MDFMQKYGIYYVATNTPVGRFASVQLVMIVALRLGPDIRHIDFVTAILNGELVDVDIYMEQPEGYDDGSRRVCKLKKGLHDLAVSRIWSDTLHKYLTEIGLVQYIYDLGLY